MITIDGLISGIDTETIIEGLLDIQKSQIDRLEVRRQGIQGKQAAYESLEVQLQTLDSIADQLTTSQGSLFKSRTVSVSNESSLFASATTKATVGTYQIHVDALARAHQIASTGFASVESEITQGTLAIQIGDGDVETITIDATNNTVQGLVDAINGAKAGVSATILNDGSSGGTPQRILLTADQTGVSHQITITNNLAASGGSAVQPVFDSGNPVQAASNAQVRLGSGAGAITVQSETNEISNLIQGVTLTLLNADVNEEIQVRVATNTEPATKSITDLATTYNAIMDFIDELVRYNPETDEAGLLIGDRTVTDIQNEIRSAVLDVVPDLESSANRLTALGISINNRARLTINETRLEDVLAGRAEGISEDDLIGLFNTSSRATITQDTRFQIDGLQLDPDIDSFSVVVTQAAEKAAIQSSPLAGVTLISFLNDSLNITLDGIDLSLDLPNGSYTPAQFASMLQNVINSDGSLNGESVTVTVDGSNRMIFESDSYGSTSEIAIRSGGVLSLLGIGTNTSDTGVDIAGHYLVNGEIEPATGNGLILTGNSANEYTANLQATSVSEVTTTLVEVPGDPENINGIGTRLGNLIGNITNVENGDLSVAKDSLIDQLTSLDDSIDRQQSIFDAQQEDLIAQFVALESAISELQTTGNFLTSQLSNLGRIGDK